MNAPDISRSAKTGHIGRPVERREDVRYLSGTSCFVDDVRRPRMLHGVVVRSTVACATIRGIDTSAARAIPGVVAVFTGAEIADRLRPIPLSPFSPLTGSERFMQMPLAVNRTVYVGEPVAFVVADNRYIAEDAADQVVVDYEPLEPVVDVKAALADRTLVHPHVGTNLAHNYRVSKGDVDAAFARAAYTRKETFRCHRHHASPLETRGLVAEWDAQEPRLRVWGSTKLLFRNRNNLSQMLQIPEEQIEMIEIDVGGCFGVRGEVYPEDFLVPYAAMALGRPVKWIEDRREHLMATNHSRDFTCELEVAVDGNGVIQAMRGTFLVDTGAYVRPNAGVAPIKGVQFMCGPYRIENAAFEVKVVVTNKTPQGSYRGPGRYESSFFRERMVDLVAADLGIEAAEFRMRNLIPPELLPWDGGPLIPGGAKTIYDTGDYPGVFKQALDAFGYASLAPIRGKMKDGRLHGVGIGCFVESTGGGPSETVRLLITDAGRAHLYAGSTSAGQGQETVLAQILADELKFPYDAIDVSHGTTSHLKTGWGSYHSRTVVMAGGAIVLAVRKLRKQLGELLARRNGIHPASIEWHDGGVIRADGKQVATLADLGRQAASDAELRAALEAADTYASSELTYTFGTQIAHVAIDPETAAIEVVRFLTMEDVGRMINPAVVHGQTLGASFQGVSASLMDHLMYDETGQLLTGSFADYLIATAADLPNLEAISLEQSRSLNNPLGAKGAGEGGIAATGGAIANAVEDALRPLGVCVRELPMSPDRIAALMRQARLSRKAA